MTADPRVHALRMQILTWARDHDLDSETVAHALADTLAVVAATMDVHGPRELKYSLTDRIDSFVEDVRMRYPQVMTQLVAHSQRVG